MTRRRATAPTTAARLALAGVTVTFGALLLAGTAAAEPVVPTPAPGEPLPPGQPVAIQQVAGGDAPPAPPPVGAPPVPEIANQQYGSGSRSGPLGFLRDAFNQAKNPYGGEAPVAAAPPPGAGPAPQLPPGYTSLNAPESNGAPVTKDYSVGPALPPGYYPLNGPPPPPEFYDTTKLPPATPGGYQPRVSPPPPPLLPPNP